jgi:hypothetical protein
MHVRDLKAAVRLTLLSIAFVSAAPVYAQNTCPAANPNDVVDDAAALQHCFDLGGTVALRPPASPVYGYQVGTTVWIRRNNLVVTSTGPGQARLIAMNHLDGPIIQVEEGTAGYVLANLYVNGNKFLRNLRSSCYGYRDFGSNMLLRGSGFRVHDVESTRAMCGSAMEVSGSNYEIWNNWVHHNGREEGTMPGDPWSDGITLLRCDNGYVHHNRAENNTDIDIVVGGGNGCRIQNNTIRHTQVGSELPLYGFAGLHIGWFPAGGSNHANSTYSGNTIFSDTNKLAFGVFVGFHPWNPTISVANGGRVQANSTSGAVVPLAIDGISFGTVTSNTASGARGSNGFGSCTRSSNYTAGDWGSTSIQSGWIQRTYHNGSCTP